MVECPPHPLAVHQRFAGSLSFRTGYAGQHDFLFHDMILLQFSGNLYPAEGERTCKVQQC
jgi:hypothetical protein